MKKTMTMEDRMQKAIHRTLDMICQEIPILHKNIIDCVLDGLDAWGKDKEAVAAFDKLPLKEQRDMIHNLLL